MLPFRSNGVSFLSSSITDHESLFNLNGSTVTDSISQCRGSPALEQCFQEDRNMSCMFSKMVGDKVLRLLGQL